MSMFLMFMVGVIYFMLINNMLLQVTIFISAKFFGYDNFEPSNGGKISLYIIFKEFTFERYSI